MISSKGDQLPPDWEMKYDFSTKRHFYVNHKTKITTWEDPRKIPIQEKSLETSEVIGRQDFIEDDADMDKIIKMIEKDDAMQKDLTILCENFPEFEKDYIKKLLIKSKSNASTVDIILRQERRKETSSIISYSTIDSGVSENKLGKGEKTRFSLSQRSKYDAPEISKDLIKSKLRSEFANVDNRIVDRVLEVTDYSLEDSRNILLSKHKSIEETIQEKETHKKESLPSFKNFVSRRSNNLPGVKTFEDNSNKNKRSLAAGPNPRNYTGSQINKNKLQ